MPAFSGPSGVLVLQLRKPWGSMGMISPTVQIDGYTVDARFGRNEIVVPAGVRQVSIRCNYMWDYGFAQDAVPVRPGEHVEVHYSTPMLTFLGGRMGPQPQPRPGMVGFTLLMGFAAIVLLAGIVAGILGS